MLPSLLPCYSLYYLGRQLLNESFLVYMLFPFHSSLPRFPHRVYNSCPIFYASPPSPILFPFPPSSPFQVLLLLSFPSPLPSPFPSCARQQVSTLVPVPVPTPSPLLSPFPACVRSFASTTRSCSRSVPIPITVCVPVPTLAPVPVSDPPPGPVRSFPSLGPDDPLGIIRVCRRRALRMELWGVRK